MEIGEFIEAHHGLGDGATDFDHGAVEAGDTAELHDFHVGEAVAGVVVTGPEGVAAITGWVVRAASRGAADLETGLVGHLDAPVDVVVVDEVVGE